jgi:hypothetical protein
MIFTRVALRTKSKGSRSVVPDRAKSYAFIRVAPRTKSKGLPIGGPLLSENL